MITKQEARLRVKAIALTTVTQHVDLVDTHLIRHIDGDPIYEDGGDPIDDTPIKVAAVVTSSQYDFYRVKIRMFLKWLQTSFSSKGLDSVLGCPGMYDSEFGMQAQIFMGNRFNTRVLTDLDGNLITLFVISFVPDVDNDDPNMFLGFYLGYNHTKHELSFYSDVVDETIVQNALSYRTFRELFFTNSVDTLDEALAELA